MFWELLGALGIPDIRGDPNVSFSPFDPSDYFLPDYTRKSAILEPKKEERDWLANMFMAKPDFADPHKKLYYASFWGAKFAAFSAATEVASQKSRNPQRSMAIVGKNFFFIVGAAATYGAVATSVANLRGQKDDIWNHAIAGASIGMFTGYAMKSSSRGAVVAAFGAICGGLFKSFYIYERNLLDWTRHSNREIAYVDGGYDFRRANWWTNTHDTKTRSERYNY